MIPFGHINYLDDYVEEVYMYYEERTSTCFDTMPFGHINWQYEASSSFANCLEVYVEKASMYNEEHQPELSTHDHSEAQPS